MPTGLSVLVQGVYLRNREEAVVVGCPLIIGIPVWGLHIDLDLLENEATP